MLGWGMYLMVPSAAGDHALCGITPPGNTQSAVEVQPFGKPGLGPKSYCSPWVTVYPKRWLSLVGQSRQGWTPAGQSAAAPGPPSTVLVNTPGPKSPPN